MVAVSLEAYRKLTLAGSLVGAVLFGAGLVTIVQALPVPWGIALMVAGIAAALSTSLLQIRGAPPRVPPSLLLVTRRECGLCDEARALLEALRAEVPFDLWEVDVDVDGDAALRSAHGAEVPVALVGGRVVFRLQFSEGPVREALLNS